VVDAAVESGIFTQVIVSTDEGYTSMLADAYRRYSIHPSDIAEFVRPSDGSGNATTAEMAIEVGADCCIYPAAGQHDSLKHILQTSYRVFCTQGMPSLWISEGCVYWADRDLLRARGDWDIPGMIVLQQVDHVDINDEVDYQKVLCNAKKSAF
jgi:CMP-N-acetylneuraminic acid synthetase